MELYQEILAKAFECRARQSVSSEYLAEIIQSESYRALCRIKAVIADDSLNDRECFMKIEEIICILEDLGGSGGFRHDFG